MNITALLLVGWIVPVVAVPPSASRPEPLDIYRRENLVAWCIVPFDAKKRGPEERAAMMRRLGLRRFAYDYRAEHVATFDAEMAAIKSHKIELVAWWFPATLNDEAKLILDVLRRHGIRTQLWVTGGGAATTSADEQRQRIEAEAARIRPIAEAADKIGCKVALYNHGGWFGDPENQIAIIEHLKLPNVGIVYNLHHGHDHLDRFPAMLAKMMPHLVALNLNGTTAGGDRVGKKILPIGEGDLDLRLLRTIRDSGYRGPIGILNHTDEDAEARLSDNLDGLDWLVRQLDGKPAGPKPRFRSYSPNAGPSGAGNPPADMGRSSGALALAGGKLIDGKAEYRSPPITVECRATLRRRDVYNILVACDTKQSGAHWEIFSMAGSGTFTAYLPGMQPDHVRSDVNICDGRPHRLAMIYEADRARLFVDGKQVADQAIMSRHRPAVPGALAIGRLVEGGLGCSGEIEYVRLSRGERSITARADDRMETDDTTLGLWKFDGGKQGAAKPPAPEQLDYSPELVARLIDEAKSHGDARSGAAVFSSAQFACISCHKVGSQGGAVGPDLTQASQCLAPDEIVESVLWPKRKVKPEFVAFSVATTDGKVHQGYKQRETDRELVLRDPATNETTQIAKSDIEAARETGTLMPEGLAAAMSGQQRRDLIRFLLDLGRKDGVPPDLLLSHGHVAVAFPYNRDPLRPELWPNWKHPVNRDRVYDFYAKEADHFVNQVSLASREGQPQSLLSMLLPQFPGLDGGKLGHWGNQNEATWADGRWNEMELGSLMCGVFRGAGVTVPRGVCVRIGERGELAACFNPDTLSYDAVWQGGFVKFSAVRHGFVDGLIMDGQPLARPTIAKLNGPVVYRGFYRHGNRVVFAYRIGDEEFLDSPWVENGKFVRQVASVASHPQRDLTRGGPPQWPQMIETRGSLGRGEQPYVIDTIVLPFDNPWKAPLFLGDHDFLPDGSAMIATMQGDVWHVTGLDERLDRVRWRRFASGLHHALGLVVVPAKGDGPDGRLFQERPVAQKTPGPLFHVFVLGRNQITRLDDLNDDGEADYYECFSNAFVTSPAGHDFICGLERDAAGNFYTASGNQGLVRISADGRRADVLATGFRNPDGLGLAPDGTITVPCSEGEWTPASMICAVRETRTRPAESVPHFGYGGPREGKPPELPLVYLPRGIDNSSGGQVFVSSDRWGPLKGQMIHLSFGAGTHFQLLRDEVDGQVQGAVVPLAGDFLSGVHRGRFSPTDGQLYVSGMTGWGSYTPADGCFQRVRYRGGPAQLPIAVRARQNGVLVSFVSRVDGATAARPDSHFAQCWNYRYSAGYGSAEFSARHPGARGHDPLAITAAHILSDGRTVFLEIPDLQPVNQLHLRIRVDAGEPHDVFATVHKLGPPFEDFAGYKPIAKTIAAHPIVADVAAALNTSPPVPNPWRKPLANARLVTIEAGKNLSFATRSFRVRAGEPIKLTFANPDVVPHNWALIQPGSLDRVGELVNRLVADPDAAARHYIPHSPDVLVYTDIVQPQDAFTIHFAAPRERGRYPFLCTFPGHWMVMNGQMIVE